MAQSDNATEPYIRAVLRLDVELAIEEPLFVALPAPRAPFKQPRARKVSGWPKRCKLGRAFQWEYRGIKSCNWPNFWANLALSHLV